MLWIHAQPNIAAMTDIQACWYGAEAILPSDAMRTQSRVARWMRNHPVAATVDRSSPENAWRQPFSGCRNLVMTSLIPSRGVHVM
jgi:hypothetical protein